MRAKVLLHFLGLPGTAWHSCTPISWRVPLRCAVVCSGGRVCRRQLSLPWLRNRAVQGCPSELCACTCSEHPQNCSACQVEGTPQRLSHSSCSKAHSHHSQHSQHSQAILHPVLRVIRHVFNIHAHCMAVLEERGAAADALTTGCWSLIQQQRASCLQAGVLLGHSITCVLHAGAERCCHVSMSPSSSIHPPDQVGTDTCSKGSALTVDQLGCTAQNTNTSCNQPLQTQATVSAAAVPWGTHCVLTLQTVWPGLLRSTTPSMLLV